MSKLPIRLVTELLGVFAIVILGILLRSAYLQVGEAEASCRAEIAQSVAEQNEITNAAKLDAAEKRIAQLQSDLERSREAQRDAEVRSEDTKRLLAQLREAQANDQSDWGAAPLPDSVRQRMQQLEAHYQNRPR